MPINKKCLEFFDCFGYDSNKKFNVYLLDDDHIIYSMGVTYQILDIKTFEK